MLRRDMELHRVTSHALGCPAAFRAMPWMDRKTTSKGWQAYVEGAGGRGAVARRGRRTVDGAERPERPWNWLTGTDASPDDLLLGGSRKVEEPFGRIDPDDVRPTPDLPDRDPRNRPDGHLARGAGRPPRDVRARRSAEVMANLRREAQRCRPESGRQRPCDRRTRSHGPSEGWLLRLRQEPRDAGMAGLLEVGARHGGLPRRIGARPQMDAGYDETDPRQGQCKPRPWVTSSP